MEQAGTISADDEKYILLTNSVDEMVEHLMKNAVSEFKLK